jgi:hypothetical protein
MLEAFDGGGEPLDILSHTPNRVVSGKSVTGMHQVDAPRVGKRRHHEVLEQRSMFGAQDVLAFSEKTPRRPFFLHRNAPAVIGRWSDAVKSPLDCVGKSLQKLL